MGIQHNSAPHVEVGYVVRCFDPRTMGVIRTGRVTAVNARKATVDFSLTGKVRVSRIDIVEVVKDEV